jgi:hypothetical protein
MSMSNGEPNPRWVSVGGKLIFPGKSLVKKVWVVCVFGGNVLPLQDKYFCGLLYFHAIINMFVKKSRKVREEIIESGKEGIREK